MSEEKRSMSTFELIVSIATIIGAIAFLMKIFGKSEGDKRDEKARKSRGRTYKDLTYPEYKYKDWSDSLIQALVPSVDEDEQQVYDIFEKQKTLGDVNKLIEYFGDQRQLYTLNWMSLPQFIGTYFSPSEKKKLNGILSLKGIDYTFE